MRALGLSLTISAALAAAGAPAGACTTFCFGNGGAPVFGKNYDWSVEAGLLVVNRAGVAKQAHTADRPASWTSRHGSVTFNQYGREFPSGGINARGLVVELMWLDDTVYAAPDARSALSNLQWIQYQLDRSATVADVIASDRDVRIESAGSAKLHFLVADATGDVAVIEFLDGRMVVTRGADLPYAVLTNHTYARSVDHVRHGTPGELQPTGSLERFARAARHVEGRRSAPAPSAVREAFALLDRVAQGEHTRWSIVYELAEHRVHFRTRANRAVRWLDLDDLDFACSAPALVADLALGPAGNLAPRLARYTPDTNRAFLLRAFAETSFLTEVPVRVVDQLARYPDGTRCAP